MRGMWSKPTNYDQFKEWDRQVDWLGEWAVLEGRMSKPCSNYSGVQKECTKPNMVTSPNCYKDISINTWPILVQFYIHELIYLMYSRQVFEKNWSPFWCFYRVYIQKSACLEFEQERSACHVTLKRLCVMLLIPNEGFISSTHSLKFLKPYSHFLHYEIDTV